MKLEGITETNYSTKTENPSYNKCVSNNDTDCCIARFVKIIFNYISNLFAAIFCCAKSTEQKDNRNYSNPPDALSLKTPPLNLRSEPDGKISKSPSFENKKTVPFTLEVIGPYQRKGNAGIYFKVNNSYYPLYEEIPVFKITRNNISHYFVQGARKNVYVEITPKQDHIPGQDLENERFPWEMKKETEIAFDYRKLGELTEPDTLKLLSYIENENQKTS